MASPEGLLRWEQVNWCDSFVARGLNGRSYLWPEMPDEEKARKFEEREAYWRANEDQWILGKTMA